MSKINELKVGDEIPALKKYVEKYQPIIYAGASGDFNPIHIDPEFGKAVGLGGNILQGLCTMAFVAQANTNWLGDPSLLKKLKVRFASPVKPDDTIVVKGKIAKKKGEKITIELWAENQKGELVITNAFSEIGTTT